MLSLLFPAFYGPDLPRTLHIDGAPISSSSAPLLKLPPELLLHIISFLIHPSSCTTEELIGSMSTLPRISRLFLSLYSDVTSLDIILPCLSYLIYLLRIMRGTQSSLIYKGVILGNRARSMTCFVDLCRASASQGLRDPALSAYTALSQINEDRLWVLRACFVNVTHVKLGMKFRLIGSENARWNEGVFEAAITVPIELPSDTTNTKKVAIVDNEPEQSYPVHVAITAPCHPSNAELDRTTALPNILQKDLHTIHLILAGPKPSTLRSPSALTPSHVNTFPLPNVSSPEFCIVPEKGSTETSVQIKWRTQLFPCPGGSHRMRILETLMTLTVARQLNIEPYLSSSMAKSSRSLFATVHEQCMKHNWVVWWLVEAALWLFDLEKLNWWQKRGGGGWEVLD